MKSLEHIMSEFFDHESPENHVEYFIGELKEFIVNNFEFHPRQAAEIISLCDDSRGFINLAVDADMLATKVKIVMKEPIHPDERPDWQTAESTYREL